MIQAKENIFVLEMKKKNQSPVDALPVSATKQQSVALRHPGLQGDPIAKAEAEGEELPGSHRGHDEGGEADGAEDGVHGSQAVEVAVADDHKPVRLFVSE